MDYELTELQREVIGLTDRIAQEKVKPVRENYLPDLGSGKRLGAFTITEPGAGSDATATRATARLDGDHYVLNGTKNFCSGGDVAEIYVVFASVNLKRGARGITAFIVEKG